MAVGVVTRSAKSTKESAKVYFYELCPSLSDALRLRYTGVYS